MSLESDLQALLGGLVTGRAYPDVLSDDPVYPSIIYQQISGQALWFGERAMPSHKHARIQVNVWAKTRTQANALARLAEGALCTSAFTAQPYGAFTDTFNELLKLYGTRQDFGIWYPDP